MDREARYVLADSFRMFFVVNTATDKLFPINPITNITGVRYANKFIPITKTVGFS